MKQSDKQELWIGMVSIEPLPGNHDLLNAEGAFVNVVAYAKDAGEFFNLINAKFQSLNYLVVDVEEVELFSLRIEKYSLRDELIELSQEVERTGCIGLDRFHTY